MCGFPLIWEEFVESVGGMSADAVEDVSQICERIDVDTLTRGNEAG